MAKITTCHADMDVLALAPLMALDEQTLVQSISDLAGLFVVALIMETDVWDLCQVLKSLDHFTGKRPSGL